MIQRVQSLWLLAAVAVMAVFCVLPFGSVAGKAIEVASDIFVLVPALVSALLCLVAIFLYRSHGRQKAVIVASMAFAIISEAFALVALLLANLSSLSWTLLLPPAAVVAQIAAWRGVNADQRLLRSYDRLR
ncbi:DUF4293 family protein [Paramuribaculum intestinale]|uniref:DUF4293 family protein n=1 Tax=Paramuribaculum intestinale TaxID=2094151 RepID=UPI0025A960D4|nr:DUF4293 family protein [Paramuribaculum intestinale]